MQRLSRILPLHPASENLWVSVYLDRGFVVVVVFVFVVVVVVVTLPSCA